MSHFWTGFEKKAMAGLKGMPKMKLNVGTKMKLTQPPINKIKPPPQPKPKLG